MKRSYLPTGHPITEARLENGLTIYVIENSSAPVLTYQTWFQVGSRHERLDPLLNRTGLAHLFEHMMFRGTETRADGEFDEILSRNGASDQNATTWNDRTHYYQSVPREKLELVMELEADRMVHLKINDELLETEKGAVVGEFRMIQDEPDQVAYDHLYLNAFQVHPYRYGTIGTEEEIKGFTRADAEYFYSTYYSPGNAVLLIAGDVDPKEVLSLTRRHYGPIRSQKVPEVISPMEPPQTQERRVEFRHAQITDPKLLIGYHAPAPGHPDHAALWLLMSQFSLGESCVLKNLWVNSGLASSVSGGLNQFKDPGLLIFSADLQPEKRAESLVQSLDRHVSEMKSADFQKAFLRARSQLFLDLYSGLEENSSLASNLGEIIPVLGHPGAYFDLLASLEQVTAQDLERVAREYLIPSRRTTVVGVPQ